MSRLMATVFVSLLKICFMWAATVIVIIPWTISQQHLIHLLGIIILGGGSIVVSAVMTVKIYKQAGKKLFPGT